MTVPAAFSLDSARRVAEATRAYEASLLGAGGPQGRPIGAPGLMLVRTPSSLPSGYDGSEALDGELVEFPQGATAYHASIPSVWIQALNNEELTQDTVYHARFAGTLTQDSTTLPYFLVDAASAAAAPAYEYVVPWRWVDVTYGPPVYGSTFTQKDLIYIKYESALNPKSGTIPDLSNMESPGENYWKDPARLNTPDLDTTPYVCSNDDPLPVYSDSNTALLSTSSTTYYEGATAAAFYMRNLDYGIPRVHSKFSLAGATVAKYGGGTLPIMSNDDFNTISQDGSYAHIITRPFLATVKYISLSGAIWGVSSTAYSWKNSSGTTKDLYFWFPDLMGLLANSASDQQVLVTPICAGKMDASWTNYKVTGRTNGDILYLITNKF